MDQNFSANLRRLRKQKGLTQEQLADAVGVSAQAVSKWEQNGFPDTPLLPAIADSLDASIDALFGREQEGVPDIFDQVLQYLLSFPKEDQIHQAFDLCWVICEMMFGSPHHDPLEKYHVDADNNARYAQTTLENGFLQAKLNRTQQYFLLMPEPESGYDELLSYSERYVQFFSVLASPDTLRAMYFLLESNAPSAPLDLFFTKQTLAHALSIDDAHAQQIIEQLLSVSLIAKASLDTGLKQESIYTYIPNCTFIAFLTFTYTLLNTPNYYCLQANHRPNPFFRNATYRNTSGAEKKDSN
ncbi:MAG: helix-turn-helix transcriptional regulator [Lachnospiraceae bacterium]|nr:helix-turn-helix transcriptional regulator [Lachnospiraceae bacterium]MBD5481963.1 helix-turn-helix transcriptional regulator [Lachnospiraceae bacterium]